VPSGPKSTHGTVLPRIERYKAPPLILDGVPKKEMYEHRLEHDWFQVPPTLIDTFVCDVWRVLCEELGLQGLKQNETTVASVSLGLDHIGRTPWGRLSGYRPWTHSNFIRQLSDSDRKILAEEVVSYIRSVGVREVVDDYEDVNKKMARMEIRSFFFFGGDDPFVPEILDELHRFRLEVVTVCRLREIGESEIFKVDEVIQEVALRRTRRYLPSGSRKAEDLDPTPGGLQSILAITTLMEPRKMVLVVADWHNRGLTKEAVELVDQATKAHGDAFRLPYEQWAQRKLGHKS
jgi:hypothetical protein